MARFPMMVASTQGIAHVLATHNHIQTGSNIAWTVNSGFRQILACNNTSLSDMNVWLDTPPGSSTSQIFYSRKNLSLDNLTCTISDSGVYGRDDTNSTSLVAGDTADIYHTWSGAVADPTNCRWSFMQNGTYQQLYVSSAAVVTATSYIGVQAGGNFSTTEADAAQVFPTGGTLQNLYAYLGSGTLTSGNYVVTMYKNGSPTSMTCTLDSSNRLNFDTSNTVSVAEGDLISWEMARNTPSSNRTILIACEFVPTNANEAVILVSTGGTAVTHTVRNTSPFYTCANLFGTGESAGKQAFALPCKFKKIYAKLGTAPGTGYSRTFGLGLNGGDSPLSVTISDTNTSGSTSKVQTVYLGDLINTTSILSSASGASSTFKIGFVFEPYNAGIF